MLQWNEKEDKLVIDGFFRETDGGMWNNPLPLNVSVKKIENTDRIYYTFIISEANEILKNYKYDILRDLKSDNDWKLYEYYTVTKIKDGKMTLEEFILTLMNDTTLLTLHIPYN